MDFPWTKEEFKIKIQDAAALYWTTRRAKADHQDYLGDLMQAIETK